MLYLRKEIERKELFRRSRIHQNKFYRASKVKLSVPGIFSIKIIPLLYGITQTFKTTVLISLSF